MKSQFRSSSHLATLSKRKEGREREKGEKETVFRGKAKGGERARRVRRDNRGHRDRPEDRGPAGHDQVGRVRPQEPFLVCGARPQNPENPAEHPLKKAR